MPTQKKKFLEAIKKYTKGYTTQAVISYDYGGEIGERNFFPNPLGMKTKDQEINQYQSMAMVTGKILKKNVTYLVSRKNTDLDYTADDIIHSAFTKTEALIAPGSLSICRVFGDKNFTKYLTRSTTTTEYLPWKLISMYEMLSNMLMHKSKGCIKTKYVGRFLNSLPKFKEGTCLNIWDKISQTLKTEELGSKSHGKKEKWDKISPLISILINMVVLKKKGSACNNNDTEVSNRTIQKDLDILESFITDDNVAIGILRTELNNGNKAKAQVLCGRSSKEKCDLSLGEQSIVKKTTIWDEKIDIKILRNELLYRGIVSLSVDVATEDGGIIRALQEKILNNDNPDPKNIDWGSHRNSCIYFNKPAKKPYNKPAKKPYNKTNLLKLWTTRTIIVSTLKHDDNERKNGARRSAAKLHWKNAINKSKTKNVPLMKQFENIKSEMENRKAVIKSSLDILRELLSIANKNDQSNNKDSLQKQIEEKETAQKENLASLEEITKALNKAAKVTHQAEKAPTVLGKLPARNREVLARLGGRKANAPARKGKHEIPEFHQFVLEF